MTARCPHCGCSLDAAKRPRSLPQLRRFFGVLRAMFHHWPDDAEFRPESEEHLRNWVTCKAGYSESADVPLVFAEDQPALTRLTGMAIEGAIKWAGSYAFVRPDLNGGRVRVFRAKSIAFHKMAPEEFNALNEAVEGVYRAETGLDPDQLLKEHERAA